MPPWRNWNYITLGLKVNLHLDRVKGIWYLSPMRAVSQEEPSDRKPNPWPFWVAGHAQLKFVMTECSKTQIRLTGLIYLCILSAIVSDSSALTHKKMKEKKIIPIMDNNDWAKTLYFNPYKPVVPFLGHRQTVQTQISRRRTRRLFRVLTVC